MSKGERIFVVIAVLVAIVWIAVVWFALSFHGDGRSIVPVVWGR
jgi:hypothetical protein